MAQHLMFFPNVLWEVQNVYAVKKQASPAFNFLGVNWKLHFHYSCTTRGQFLQIFLKRLAPSSKIPFLLCAKTSLVGDNAYSYFETNTSIDTSSSNEWCIWDENRQNVSSYVKGTALMFLCYIQPESRVRKILHKNADKGMKPAEGNADTDSLRKDFGNLFDKHIGADVVFNCKGEKICAHRAVLSGRSPIFAAMFQADMKESREGVIDITDTEPFTLRLFLRYLYTGDLPDLSLNTSVKLYFLADKYGIDVLKRNCVFFMTDSLEVDVPEGTAESSNEKNLTMKIRSRLRNIREVLCTDNWKYMNDEHLKMSLDAFDTLFKGICSELNTVQGNDTTLLTQDVPKKKIKLMKSECNEYKTNV